MIDRLLLYTTTEYRQEILDDIVVSLREKGMMIDERSFSNQDRSLIFFMLLPFRYITTCLSLLLRRLGGGFKTVLCCGWQDKVVVTPMALLCGYRVYWLDIPKFDAALPNVIGSTRVTRLIFGLDDNDHGSDSRIHIIPPTCRGEMVYQGGLFQQLAQPKRQRFVVGAIVRSLDRVEMERLLSAISIAISICPTIELVVIGDGEARKQAQWLVRKLKLEGKVWLAGSDEKALSWFEHIDVYVSPQTRLDLNELSDIVFAFVHGTPVLAHNESGAERIVSARRGAVVDVCDAEVLARAIIRLQQDSSLRLSLGENASKTASKLTHSHLTDTLSHIIT